jgi:hypothetical protein
VPAAQEKVKRLSPGTLDTSMVTVSVPSLKVPPCSGEATVSWDQVWPPPNSMPSSLHLGLDALTDSGYGG